ncbi:MAG: DinB family protein [Terriglobales bacterium]|jgi:uncharacterized damage-inducible protein DinB
MQSNITGFRREYLSELEIARTQLLALAGIVPDESYGWGPVPGARSFSAVLVHIAAGNLLLLYRAGVRMPVVIDLYGAIEGDTATRLVAIIRQNVAMETTMVTKFEVVHLLDRSFQAVAEAMKTATDDDLDVVGNFFGEPEAVRRLYLRLLTHSHEHMGQAVAYVRTMGYKVPWPDPLVYLDRAAASEAAQQLTA